MDIFKNYKAAKASILDIIDECKTENILLYLIIVSLISGLLFGIVEFIERSYATGYVLDAYSKIYGAIYSGSWMAEFGLLIGLLFASITGITISIMIAIRKLFKKLNKDSSSAFIILVIIVALLLTILEIYFYFTIPKPDFTYYFLLSKPVSTLVYYKIAFFIAFIIAAIISLKLEYKRNFCFIKSFILSFIMISALLCLLFYFINSNYNTLIVWNNFYKFIFSLYYSNSISMSAIIYLVNFVIVYILSIILLLIIPRLWKYKIVKAIVIAAPFFAYSFYYIFTMNYLVGQTFFVIPIGNIHYMTGLISYIEFYVLTIIVFYFAGFTPIKLKKYNRKYKWTILMALIVALILIPTYLKPKSNKLKAFNEKNLVIQKHLTQKWIDPIFNKKPEHYFTLPSDKLCLSNNTENKINRELKTPNIFLISIDALRTDFAINKELAPNLNEFINNAYFFKNNYSHATHTPASLSSISTSKYFTASASCKFETLSSLLEKNGYKTKAFVGFNLANPKLKLDTTYNNNVKLSTPITKRYSHLEMIKKTSKNTDSNISKIAESHINNYIGNKPLFLWLHLYQLHEIPVNEVFKNFISSNSFKKEYSKRLKNTDKLLGEYINNLKHKKLYDNSLIVIFSDHGEEIKEHSSFFHTYSLYNELIKVPLIIKFPGQKKGVTIESATSSLDLTPTILNYIGINTNKYNFCGEDLNKIINENTTNERLPISSLYRGFYYKSREAEKISSSILMTSKPIKYQVNRLTSYAIIDKNSEWKLIYNLDPEYFELYNLKKDPTEKNNLADKKPKKLNQLLKQLEKQLKTSN